MAPYVVYSVVLVWMVDGTGGSGPLQPSDTSGVC